MKSSGSFGRREVMPLSKEVPPAVFQENWMSEYQEAAAQDEALAALLTDHQALNEHIATGAGVADDATQKERIERAIATRYAQILDK